MTERERERGRQGGRQRERGGRLAPGHTERRGRRGTRRPPGVLGGPLPCKPGVLGGWKGCCGSAALSPCIGEQGHDQSTLAVNVPAYSFIRTCSAYYSCIRLCSAFLKAQFSHDLLQKCISTCMPSGALRSGSRFISHTVLIKWFQRVSSLTKLRTYCFKL